MSILETTRYDASARILWAPSGASFLDSGRQFRFQRANGAWRVPRKIPAFFFKVQKSKNA